MSIVQTSVKHIAHLAPSTPQTGKVRTYQAYVPLPHVFPPSAIRQSPTGRDTLTARTLSDVASLCHSLRWCKKNHSAPATSYNFWCLGFASSSPLLLAFRLRKSECFYKNSPNKPSVYCFLPQLRTK